MRNAGFAAVPNRRTPLRLTEILIADGFVVAETVGSISRLLLETIHKGSFREKRIHFKGELRDCLSRGREGITPRVEELFRQYGANPDFYYREAPINAMMYLDDEGRLLGLSRIKRPKRIAEKANRKIANWIFQIVQTTARKMAERRAEKSGIPLQNLLTPEKEMVREFIEAEKRVARCFRDGEIKFDRAALSINDIGGLKILGEETKLANLETILAGRPGPEGSRPGKLPRGLPGQERAPRSRLGPRTGLPPVYGREMLGKIHETGNPRRKSSRRGSSL